MTPEFNKWWDGDDMTDQNQYDMGHPIYWAWEGWVAGQKAEREKSADLLKALENMVGMVELNLFDKHVVMNKARQVIKKARGEG